MKVDEMMRHNKDNQEETLFMEMAVGALILGILYVIIKVLF